MKKVTLKLSTQEILLIFVARLGPKILTWLNFAASLQERTLCYIVQRTVDFLLIYKAQHTEIK